jgi:hypothetical protein
MNKYGYKMSLTLNIQWMGLERLCITYAKIGGLVALAWLASFEKYCGHKRMRIREVYSAIIKKIAGNTPFSSVNA